MKLIKDITTIKNLHKDLYNKFPSILKEKLKSGEIAFPNGTEYHYDKIEVYRAVARKKDDFSCVNRNDMQSYAEKDMNKRVAVDSKKYDENDPHYYGVSFFTNIRYLKVNMKFPRKNMKIAKGYVYQEGGPQHTKKEKHHVCWWIFKNVSFDDFIFCEEDGNG